MFYMLLYVYCILLKTWPFSKCKIISSNYMKLNDTHNKEHMVLANPTSSSEEKVCKRY